METLTVGGRTLRVDVRPGTGTRPPLLLLNGIGASLEMLDPFVEALPADLEVVRFDVPGVGGSPQPSAPYRMPALARTVGALVRELGHPQVDVLGYSWGGGLAQQVALSERALVRRLVLVATGTGSLMVPGRPNVLSKMLTRRRYSDPAYAAQVAGEIYGGSMRTHPERAARLLHGGPTQRGYLYQLLAGAGWTTLPALWMIGAPTLVVAGDDDPIIPLVNARILHRGIPRSTLHVYRGGHLALLTEPAELAPTIERFLRP
ncbi:poly(3-hydroxyalkanoate) depolymerase [Pseudonocardia sp. WMMC193]|uniref:poly(3-hydroxyalkanoate) depolymerase n=1 Tax=Pseudonocardia sp. WMMC193 TaxID=2911965 RepID=UPI001F02973C|nr:poly(3-hydroxyalkanoate) depolymerase [Pseudonocardia sp. WMMC193]MCF7549830.1 poly(3-hydroxyalkanoate) depolymerase [Pseudonocardia sp. WMMC193]